MRIARICSEVCTTSGSRSFSVEQLAAAHRLGLALLGQVDVHPAGEQVLEVPGALPVAEQDQGRHAAQPTAAARVQPMSAATASTAASRRRSTTSASATWRSTRPRTLAGLPGRPRPHRRRRHRPRLRLRHPRPDDVGPRLRRPRRRPLPRHARARRAQRAPGAVPHASRCVDASIPPSVAVTAIGEALNYATDPRAGLDAHRRGRATRLRRARARRRSSSSTSRRRAATSASTCASASTITTTGCCACRRPRPATGSTGASRSSPASPTAATRASTSTTSSTSTTRRAPRARSKASGSRSRRWPSYGERARRLDPADGLGRVRRVEAGA